MESEKKTSKLTAKNAQNTKEGRRAGAEKASETSGRNGEQARNELTAKNAQNIRGGKWAGVGNTAETSGGNGERACEELTAEKARPAATRGRGPELVGFEAVEPWPERVNGAELLDELVGLLARFVVFPKWGAETFALWILHTYAYRLREVATYIGIESPERECGKSTLLTLLSRLVERPAVSSNISASAFFRVIEELEPTLLIDEADTNLRGKDDLMGILNSGYTKQTGFVWRICYDGAAGPEADGAGGAPGRVARYSSWCPKAIAAIGHLHPTLASRCIVVRMQRKRLEERCERLKGLEAVPFKRKCARFVAENAEAIGRWEPEIPEGLTNRAADIWEPLLVLAEAAGGRWPALARETALGVTARGQEESPAGSLLLDILVAFRCGQVERLFTRELLARLDGCGERPWGGLLRGRKLSETWLAQQLRPYGIRPRTIRMGEQVAKGYVQADMMETFRRYIPRMEVEALKAELAEREVKEASAAETGEPVSR